MRKHSLRFSAGFLAAISTLVALPSASEGQALYWDTNGNDADFGNFSGD